MAEEQKTEETAVDAAAPVAEITETAPVAEAAAEEKKSRLPTAADLLADEKIEPIKRKKGSKNVPFGIAFVKTTFNNTIVSITDMRGNVISWSSAGRCNFKGSRKSTPYAAQLAGSNAAKKGIEHGLKEIHVYVKGPGSGREAAIRSLQSSGLNVASIRDVTPIPHNGCRARKRRRV